MDHEILIVVNDSQPVKFVFVLSGAILKGFFGSERIPLSKVPVHHFHHSHFYKRCDHQAKVLPVDGVGFRVVINEDL